MARYWLSAGFVCVCEYLMGHERIVSVTIAVSRNPYKKIHQRLFQEDLNKSSSTHFDCFENEDLEIRAYSCALKKIFSIRSEKNENRIHWRQHGNRVNYTQINSKKHTFHSIICLIHHKYKKKCSYNFFCVELTGGKNLFQVYQMSLLM